MRIFIIFFVLFYASVCHGQEIKLPAPDKQGGAPLMQCLSRRASERSFSGRLLEFETLSELLWAAYGVNRIDSGMRTAPSAHNAQEITVYAALPDGVYRYDAEKHTLVLYMQEDIRVYCGKQDFVKTAPVVLIYVADISAKDGIEDYIEVDTGFISQNVYLYCASEGLATVVLGWVDKEALAVKLKLGPNQRITYTQPVGTL